jgi:multicomponent Na+:H+ antiporter subunit G
MAALIDLARLGLGGVLAALGIAALCGGALGLLRFPDFYTRIHAASVIGVGAVLIAAGLVAGAAELAMALRLGAFAALLAVLSPTLAHVVAGAGHAAGLAPLAGRYAAPRPGAAKERAP